MTGMDIFNTTVGILGIISFVFSLWVWMKSDMKIRELSGLIEAINDIASSAVWEWETTLKEDKEIKLNLAEKILGIMSSVKKLTQRYAKPSSRPNIDNTLSQLIEKGIIIPQSSNIWAVESAKNLSEIWLVTPDLKPDTTQEAVGKLTNQNLRQGKKYVYFIPDDLPHIESEIDRLYKNTGVADSKSQKLKEKMTIVRLDKVKHSSLFHGGNVILYFLDKGKGKTPRCFEEIILTQITERGAFWQEHSEGKSNELRHLLEKELRNANCMS